MPIELEDSDPRQAVAQSSDIEQRGKVVKWKPVSGKGSVSRKFDTEEAATEWLKSVDCRQTGTMQERRKMTAASVENLDAFFTRFKEMSIGSSPELDVLIGKAQEAIAGQDSDALRMAPDELRESIRATMAEIGERLDAMTVAGGGRNIDWEE